MILIVLDLAVRRRPGGFVLNGLGFSAFGGIPQPGRVGHACGGPDGEDRRVNQKANGARGDRGLAQLGRPRVLR